jgi:hypothetical protein
VEFTYVRCNVDTSEALDSFMLYLIWVRELHLERVDFALDSKRVVDYFNKGGSDVTDLGDVIGECHCVIDVNFENMLNSIKDK